MNNQLFDKLVKQNLADHESPVPPGTWDAIARKKKKRRYPLFWWITGFVLLFGFGTWKLYEWRTGENAAVTSSGKTAHKKSTIPDKSNRALVSVPLNNNTAAGTTQSGTPPPPQASVTENSIDKRVQRPAGIVDVQSYTGSQMEKATLQNNIIAMAGKTGNRARKNKKIGAVLPNSSSSGNVSEIEFRAFADMQTRTGSDDGGGIIEEYEVKTTGTDSVMIIPGLKNDVAGNIHAGLPDSTILPAINAANTPALPVKPVKRKKSTWAVDISITPFLPVQQQQPLSFITRTTITSDHKAEYRADKIRASLQPALSYGITIRKEINKRLQAGAGIRYTVIKESVVLSGNEVNTHYTVVQRLENGSGSPVLVNDTVETITSGIRTIDAVNSYRFISIPVSVQYMLVNRPSWALLLNGGLSLDIATRYNNSINGKLVAAYASGGQSVKRANNSGIGIFAGIRMSKQVSAGWQVFAEPLLRYNTRRYEMSDMINYKFMHQAGISFGLTYIPIRH